MGGLFLGVQFPLSRWLSSSYDGAPPRPAS